MMQRAARDAFARARMPCAPAREEVSDLNSHFDGLYSARSSLFLSGDTSAVIRIAGSCVAGRIGGRRIA
jgi:hypothetical protein